MVKLSFFLLLSLFYFNLVSYENSLNINHQLVVDNLGNKQFKMAFNNLLFVLTLQFDLDFDSSCCSKYLFFRALKL